jgi:hypothetical protein
MTNGHEQSELFHEDLWSGLLLTTLLDALAELARMLAIEGPGDSLFDSCGLL